MIMLHVFPADSPAKPKMTVEEFKDWLLSIDTNGDGRISKKELEEALLKLNFKFAGWKAWRALNKADINKNKGIDYDVPEEMDKLIECALGWGVIIVQT
uniref:EF-hand domain-containing protein n=1 Tax=Nelumbo nucifera TaxID=4432 RepID=A0A822XU85_NELNU|nr:TPA_asm: hypothetical protein HUJ06_026648 [Nelumbo nucifera]